MATPKEVAQRLSGELTIEIDEYGSKVWVLNGKLHREDEPAIECVNGYKAWWVKGVFIRSQCCDPS